MAEPHDIPEMMKEFVSALMTYLKQRGAEFVSAVVVDPLRKMALKVGLGCAGMVFVSLGVIFLGLFMVHGFARLFYNDILYGYLASAILILIVGAVLLWLMSRSGKEEEKKDDKNH
ncbi:MAG: hypothetical protein ACYC63_18670 [Armatimonadota bacterium]